MTLTQLAQKHNLEPESAKAFLREWLDMQKSYPINRKHGETCILIFKNTELRKSDILIGRPTDLGD